MENSKLITFDTYRHKYVYNNDNICNNLDYILRFWKANKEEYLTKLFDDKLILDKPITFEQPVKNLIKEAEQLCKDYRSFIDLYLSKVDEYYPLNNPANQFPQTLLNSLISPYHLVTNKTPDFAQTITLKFDDTKIVVQQEMKTMKLLSKVCAAIGIQDEFEKFRIAQSMLTNQKRITGTLHLSIHPMDYATASDNNSGWSSCMSWENEGCYRLGTIEMMNSPVVICAYISSDKVDMNINEDTTWNSKKWRAWVIVHPQYIFVNRHYPYHSDEIALKVLDWVKSLVKEKLGWEYGENITDLVAYWNDKCDKHEWPDNNIILTNYMYNDVGGSDIVGCMSVKYNPENYKDYQYEINISGPAECMCCGRQIDLTEHIDPGTLVCPECDVRCYCSECGRELEPGYDEIYEEDGNTFCFECYHRYFSECTCCGCITRSENIRAIVLPFNTNSWHNDPKIIYVCEDCIQNYSDYIISAYKFSVSDKFTVGISNDRWLEDIEDTIYDDYPDFVSSNFFIINPYSLQTDKQIEDILNLIGYSRPTHSCGYQLYYYEKKIVDWRNSFINGGV